MVVRGRIEDSNVATSHTIHSHQCHSPVDSHASACAEVCGSVQECAGACGCVQECARIGAGV